MTLPPTWERERDPVVMLGCGGYLEGSVPKSKPETQLLKELGVPQLNELKFHIHYPKDCF